MMNRLLIAAGFAAALLLPGSAIAQQGQADQQTQPDQQTQQETQQDQQAPPEQSTMQNQKSPHTWNHGEIGVYGDLFRVAPSGASATNYLGLGGRVSVNTGAHLALEGEMSYDFEQNYTSININGSGSGGNGSGSGSGSSTTYTASVRPISGLFGPKLQFGTTGPFRAFVEAKAGFIDFTTSCNAPAGSSSCFSSSLNNFGGSSTHFAAFPGGGVEAFFGPVGIRVDAGDELYMNNGTYNNLRVTFGPTFRF